MKKTIPPKTTTTSAENLNHPPAPKPFPPTAHTNSNEKTKAKEPRRSYKDSFHLAMKIVVCLPLTSSAEAREFAAEMIAKEHPEVLVRALRKYLPAIRKELGKLWRGHRQAIASAATAGRPARPRVSSELPKIDTHTVTRSGKNRRK